MGTPDNLSVKQQFLIDYWQEKASPEGWVDKIHVNLRELARISPNLILLKLLKSREPGQWKFTLVGTGIVDEYCHDFTGSVIDEIPFEHCKLLYHETVKHSLENRVPHIIHGDFCYDKNGLLEANEVSIPVSENGKSITHILIVCDVVRTGRKRTLYHPDNPCHFSYRIFPYLN